MYRIKSINCYKHIFYICTLLLIIQVKIVKAFPVQLQISQISEKIIENKVQIKLIDEYIYNLEKIYQKKISSLKNKYQEIATSVSILYKIKNHPKEILLAEVLNQNNTLNIYVTINYWAKSANSLISKTYLELNDLKKTTKSLNQAKHKLLDLNQQLMSYYKKLNKLTNNVSQQSNIQEINNIRTILKYNATINKQNLKLFANIDKPLLTPTDKEKDSIFVTNNKGKMVWPNNGYIYSNFQSSKYYNLTYFGISLLAQPQTPIVAPADGEIIFANTLEKYNYVIMIKHSPSYVSIISGKYIPLVKLSKKVKINEIIGQVESYSTLIYYELNKQTEAINPINWLETKNS